MAERNINEQKYGCDTCWPTSSDAAYAAFKETQTITRVLDESHYIVNIRQCGKCRQKFVSVFTETIDWQDGEDPQYRTVMPISENEAEDVAKLKDTEDLTRLKNVLEHLAPRRCGLKTDFPKGAPKTITSWGYGILIGPHD